MATKRVNPPVDPHSASSDAAAGGKKSAPPPFTPTPSSKKKTGYYQPVAQLVSVENQDEGQDYVGKPGSDVVAIGNAVIDGIYHNVKGFGTMIVYTLQTGHYGGTKIYVGHATEVAGLRKGQVVNGGSAIAVLNKPAGSTATTPGWVEVGIANKAGTAPSYQSASDPHAPRTPGGLALKQLLGQALTPQEKSDVKAAQANADANNNSLIQSRVQLAGEEALAKQTAHITDPWVTVVKDNNGVTRFGTATGFNAPKNALSYGGMPLTKSELSSVWGSRYADIYEEYTGKVATPAVVAQILDDGYSAYGLQAALAGGKLQSWKTFMNSPAYKQQANSYQAASQSVLGGNAPKSVLQQAFAEKWDTTSFAQALRTYKAPDGSHPYLKGPEYTNNQSAMQTTYQKIYGVPDENANSAINEAAANGWDANHFANYLRQQPEYTTSVEYQSNAANLVDNLGLLFRMAPVMSPVKKSAQPSGGEVVANSPLVPGAPKTLNPVLGVAASLQPVGANG